MEERVLHIHYIAGSEGIRIVDLGGWSGKAFVVSRSDISKLFKIESLKKAGIYFLFGEDTNAKRQLYIGESELLDGRINYQDSNKDFWEVAVIFTDGLDGAKARYLENKALKLAGETGRFEIMNKKGADSDTLAAYSRAEADQYFQQCSFVLAALGFPVFKKIEKKSDTKEYFLTIGDISASGYLTDDQGFVIRVGSFARLKSSEACPPGVVAIRNNLMQAGRLQERGGKLTFVNDEYFTSVSTAAAVVRGTSANGWDCWKDNTGKTLNENVRK